MNGKIVGSFIVVSGLIAGFALYYLQVYFFFDEVPPEELEIRLTLAAANQTQAIAVDQARAIDGTSSPLKFRACFNVGPDFAPEAFRTLTRAEPLTAPGWFDCFDADAIGAAIAAGDAQVYMGEAEIHDGVDRVVALFPDGRGFAWQQLNEKYQQ